MLLKLNILISRFRALTLSISTFMHMQRNYPLEGVCKVSFFFVMVRALKVLTYHPFDLLIVIPGHAALSQQGGGEQVKP